jgi:hypothetical protein
MNYISSSRPWIAIALSLVLMPFVQSSLFGQDPPPGAYAPLDAMQLDRMVAPIALYPDSLVAQVLTASTFADQVSDSERHALGSECESSDRISHCARQYGP